MVLTSEIEAALNRQKKFLLKKATGVKRRMLEKYEPNSSFVLIITGIRRSGKSTLMDQFISENKEEIVYLNFEDPRIFGFDLNDFIKLDDLLGDEPEYYFFDEIQNVENWEVFVRNLHDRGKKVCITGSNASLLSKELGTKLTGRNIQLELFPFSYQEFCRFKKYDLCEKSFNKYLETGGFPEFVKTSNKEYLQQLFRDVVYRDIIVRHGIRNDKVFIDIALFLLSNAAKEYSLTSIKNTFKVGSTNSVADYVQWLEDSYLVFSVPRFSWSLKSVAVNRKKVYTIDPAFAEANSLSYSKDSGRLFENTIFLALRRKYTEIYYFKESGECDFVIKEGRKVTAVIQVCQKINYDNKDRELAGLFEAMDFFKLNTGTIITKNQSDTVKKEDKTVKLVPAYKFVENLGD